MNQGFCGALPEPNVFNTTAFSPSTWSPLTRGCELAVEEVHPQSECLDCGEVFEHDRFHCRCPQCGGANVRLLHGRELDIASIEIETPDD